MEKLFYTIIIVLAFTSTLPAQTIAKDALGLRLTTSEGFGADLSYQHAFSQKNRLELDLGWRNGNEYDGFKLSALEQLVLNIKSGFNWYIGGGGGVASYNYDYNEISGLDINDNYTFLFLAANVGIEYNFASPIVISLDVRPELGLSDSNFRNDNFVFDIGVALRYRFK